MSLADANRKYFDLISDDYDKKPWWAKVNQQVADALNSRLDWIGVPFSNSRSAPNSGREVRLLDYACGPGLMSRIFAPYVDQTRGIDISPKMVDIYNTRAQAAVAELYPSKINAVVGDLFSKSDPNPASLSGPEYHDFDLATVGFGFHHFEDVVHASRCLKERLRSGGVLLFSDFLQGGDLLVGEDGKPVEGSEGDHMVHHHHGHSHGHDHGHDHGHQEQHHDSHHGGHHHTSAAEQTSASPATNEINNDSTKDLSTMNASIVVPSFTIDGVKEFLTEAGFVDVDIMVMEQKAYMEFGGKKMYRTVFFARGRRPLE